MNLKTIFKIQSLIFFVNGTMLIFFTTSFLEMANFTMTPNLVSLGQVFGCAAYTLSIISFRTPDIAGDAIKDYGKLFFLGQVFFGLMIGWHLFTGVSSGPTPAINLAINIIFGTLFLMYSRD